MKRLACLIIASILLFSFVLIAPVAGASQTALPDHPSPMKYVSDTSSVPDSLAKPMGKPLVDTFITEVSQDTWIFFPWDTGLSFQPPIRDGAA